MIGKGDEYDYLNNLKIDFPHNMSIFSQKIFKSERHFLEFLIRNDWIQRRIGIKASLVVNGLFPDIKGEIYDGIGGKIRVEVEYKAENYSNHKHPWGGCDLILSFIRNSGTRIIRGCPVWSFYYKKKDTLVYCLEDDIGFNFNEYVPDEEEFGWR